ncbi:MAG: type IV pilus modification PilV family protein [Gemmatimonadota bacterium]
MNARDRLGFTLVETMVAVLVLGIGIVALLGATGMVTRMLGAGRRTTIAAQVASSRLERLRMLARSTWPRCGDPGFVSGGPVATAGIMERWEVQASGPARTVRVVVDGGAGRTAAIDMFVTVIRC